MPRSKLYLDRSLSEAVFEFCKAQLVLPEDLLRLAIRQPVREPFLLQRDEIAGRTETERMLKILDTLWVKAPQQFEAAATGIGGHSRLWFAKDPADIHGTGSSNSAQRIGKSPWWVSTNCPLQGMLSRVEKVMRKMGFSGRYSSMVAWTILDERGRLYRPDFFDT
jgi:negative regulator of replication initiation